MPIKGNNKHSQLINHKNAWPGNFNTPFYKTFIEIKMVYVSNNNFNPVILNEWKYQKCYLFWLGYPNLKVMGTEEGKIIKFQHVSRILPATSKN